jgi:lysophospholipase L1-like esterase
MALIRPMGMRLAALTLVSLALPVLALAAPPKPAPVSTAAETWAAAWEASPEAQRAPLVPIGGQTLRQIAHVTLGGIFIRVRLSNEFGDKPLTIGAAHVGISGGAATVQAGTDQVALFGGKPTIVIPPGARVLSDPIRMTVPAMSNVAVSLYVPAYDGAVTSHYFTMQTAYMAAGDTTAAPDMPGASQQTHDAILTGVDVSASRDTKVTVVLGDSLTAGFGSTTDTNRRFSDLLAVRLATRNGGPPIGVVNAGIGGNRLLHDFFGPNALARFDRDVLSQPDVGFLIVLLGIDDFGLPGGRGLPDEEVTADDVIQGYRQLIARAHSSNIKVFIGTIPAFAPLPDRPGYYSPASELKREVVNQWIRANSREFEGVIDFEGALHDPKVKNRILPSLDSGDHLDPNDAGYQAMANIVVMRLFQ